MEPDKFIDKGINYAVRDISKYKDKEIVIFGGGDSALDWSVELAKIAKKISLVHRRDDFRGAQHTEKKNA
jgi:thioredoxin reductase (NADPH)